MNPTLTLTYLLVGALLTNVLLKLWLNARQVRHVASHRAQVPETFATQISLADHQKAADYTLAKLQLGYWDLALDAVVLLGWTLMGGLTLLDSALMDLTGPGMLQQLLLVLGFMLISGLINLPVSYYQTFKIEQHFGFNRSTPALWWSDMAKGIAVGAVLGLPILALVLP